MTAPEPDPDPAATPPPVESAPAPAARPRRRKPLGVLQESVLLIATALVLAIVVKAFFVQAFYIPSGSMENTLIENDRILVQKVSYWSGDVERGDIVVFDDPGEWLTAAESGGPSNLLQKGLETVGLYPSGGHLVKRVIGVAGDVVGYCQGESRVTVNGELIDEPYLRNGGKGFAVPGADTPGCTTVTVAPDRIWVMGDNRGNSADSRAHTGLPGGGQVDVDLVVGKAWSIVWPLSRFGGTGEEDFDNARLDQLQGAVAGDG